MGVYVTVMRMSELQDSVRTWLRAVLDETGLSASALARQIGTSTTTLTRALNDPNSKHVLSMRTIDAISRATGKPGPNGQGGTQGQAQGGDQAAAMFDPALGRELDGRALPVETGDARVDDAVRYLCAAENGLYAQRLNSRALEGVGYLPGDVMVVDLNQSAKLGDVVVAQIYKQRGAETVFRLYAKPFLIAAALDRCPHLPMLVDDDRVSIRGVVVASFRPRRGHLHAA